MKAIFNYLLPVVCIISVAVSLGCERPESKQSSVSSDKTERYLVIKGSDTMVHLASTWAEKFMQIRPGSEVSVTGGGSGTGIAALINGTTNICAASRDIKEKELKIAQQKGVDPVGVVVARDAITVIVNPSNPVSELTVEQIGKIFSGVYSRWSEVGGDDQPIIVLSRESSSGTFVFFQEHVLNKADYTRNARFLPGTSAVVQAIENDKLAIGYVGLGFAAEANDKVKALLVKEDVNKAAVASSEETVTSGEYSIARPLYFYTNGQPGGLVKEFIDFCLSVDGKKIVRETGYVP